MLEVQNTSSRSHNIEKGAKTAFSSENELFVRFCPFDVPGGSLEVNIVCDWFPMVSCHVRRPKQY